MQTSAVGSVKTMQTSATGAMKFVQISVTDSVKNSRRKTCEYQEKADETKNAGRHNRFFASLTSIESEDDEVVRDGFSEIRADQSDGFGRNSRRGGFSEISKD